jgi:hypothetical protein
MFFSLIKFFFNKLQMATKSVVEEEGLDHLQKNLLLGTRSATNDHVFITGSCGAR